jgi:hypothetical protein
MRYQHSLVVLGPPIELRTAQVLGVNGNVVEKEQSRLMDNSMKETNQKLPEGEMVGNQEKIELDRS